MTCSISCKDCLMSKPLKKGFDIIGNYIAISTIASKNKGDEILPLTKSLFSLIAQYEATNDVVISALSVVLFTMTEDMAQGLLKTNPECKQAKEFLDAYAASNP